MPDCVGSVPGSYVVTNPNAIVYTRLYIQNSSSSRFITLWTGTGRSTRALFEEPATLIFWGRAADHMLIVGSLVRDQSCFNSPPPQLPTTPKQYLWEIISIEEYEDRSSNPSTWNTRCYCRKTTPEAAPGDSASFSKP